MVEKLVQFLLYDWDVLCNIEMLMLPAAFKICASFWLWVSVFWTNAFSFFFNSLNHPDFFSCIIPPGMERKGNVDWKLLSARGELSDQRFLRQILERASQIFTVCGSLASLINNGVKAFSWACVQRPWQLKKVSLGCEGLHGNAEEAGCALKHTLLWLQKCMCWPHSLSMCTHFQEKSPLLFSSSALLAVPSGALISLTITNPASWSMCSTNCLQLWSSLEGRDSVVFQEFRLSPQQIISVFAAEGSRRSVLFFSISQSSILLAFSHFPFKQHHPAESRKPPAESGVKGMWWVQQQLEASLTGSFSLLTPSAVMCKDEGEF